jgi:divalent metal cation (Fe/Co/Zn/Cd) transporter
MDKRRWFSRSEPRRFIAAELSGWDARLKTAMRWSAMWAVVKLLAGLATGGWSLVADGIASGSELLAVGLLHASDREKTDATNKLILKGVLAALLFSSGVIIMRIGFGQLLSPSRLLPVLFLIVSALIMAGQFIAARYVASRYQMTVKHAPVYRVLAGNVLSSVFITLAAAACNVQEWRQTDTFLALAIGIITILRAVGNVRALISELLEEPQEEPGMLEVAAVLCGHPLVLETHSLRLRRDGREQILRATIVLDRDQFPLALMVKSELEHRIRKEFGIKTMDVRFELKPGAKAFWHRSAVYDQCSLN